jgi:hypothetical protein
VAGGYFNRAGEYSFAAGDSNNAYGGYAAIPGGYANQAGQYGLSAGYYNLATGTCATTAGGYGNQASHYAFAAGQRALATNQGAFVWADNSVALNFGTTSNYQFLIRAANGVGIGTNRPLAALHVAGKARFDAGVSYIPPMGNLSMGVYTNGM